MAFKDWYARNRDKLNRRRRKRYRTDEDYREKQLGSTKRWRKKSAKAKAKLPVPPKTVFTIGEVAEKLNCEQKTIRTLEKANLIPSTSDGVHHRRFNKRQIALIGKVVAFRKRVHYRDPDYRPGLKSLSAAVHSQWGNL